MFPPSKEEDVVSAKPDDVVCLCRGCRPETGERLAKSMTAGGYDTSGTPGLEPYAPSEEEAVRQVIGGSGSGFFKSNLPRLPEFTTSIHLAQTYSSGAIVCIAIKRKFLTKGSVSECGWIARHEAPLVKVAWAPYNKPHSSGKTALVGKGGKHLIGD